MGLLVTVFAYLQVGMKCKLLWLIVKIRSQGVNPPPPPPFLPFLHRSFGVRRFSAAKQLCGVASLGSRYVKL